MFTYSFFFFSYWGFGFCKFSWGGAEGEGKKTRKPIERNYDFLYMYVFRFKGLVFKAVVCVKASKTAHPIKK